MPARIIDAEAIDGLIARLDAHARAAVARVRKASPGTLAGVPALVYGLLNQHRKPLGAYDLIAELSRLTGRPVRPPTVYRALDQLIARRLVARLASRNAFAACAHPGHSHDCVLLVCDRCGRVDELEDARLDTLILEDLRRSGFRPRHRTLEVEGACKACQEA